MLKKYVELHVFQSLIEHGRFSNLGAVASKCEPVEHLFDEKGDFMLLLLSCLVSALLCFYPTAYLSLCNVVFSMRI